MNTNPDDTQIMLWLEDELPSYEQTKLDTWAINHPHLLEKRNALRAWRENLRTHIPAELPPAYPDFFHSKLQKEISLTTAPAVTKNVWWKKFSLPVAAAAALILSFYVGRISSGNANNATVIYTPHEGVSAEFIQNSPAQGTVIVLNGVNTMREEGENSMQTASGQKKAAEEHTSEKKIAPVAP